MNAFRYEFIKILKQQCAKLHVFECLEKQRLEVTAAAAV